MQTMRRLYGCLGGPTCVALSALLIGIPLSIGRSAHAQTSAPQPGQDAELPAAAPMVPQQVRYSGKLANRAGQTVDAEFRIYAVPQDGEPLWTETQRFPVAEDGSYSVLLGSTDPRGLPQAVFAAGKARWLGVSVERAPESDRVLLASVPYAMKSADAESLAGHAAADFVTQEQLAELEAQRASAPAPAITPDISGTVTGSGTAGIIPVWTGSLTQGKSNMVEVGTHIGINEISPGATLDVNGTGIFRGTLTLPALATATTSAAQRSQIMQWSASAWSTTAKAPVAPTFRLFANPQGNNTATPGGTLFFQYQLGTTTTSVLTLASNGALTSFGGVAVAPPSLATKSAGFNSPLMELGASAWSSGTAKAVAQNFAWRALATGNDTSTPSGNLALLYSSGAAAPASTGLSISPKGIINWASGQTFPGTGDGTITGITTSSPLTGSGASGSVALGLNTSSLETTLNGVYAQLGAADDFTGEVEAHQSGGAGHAALLGYGTSGSTGTYGSSDTGYGVEGTSTSGQGVFGQVTTPAAGSEGVLGRTGTAFSATYSSEDGIANAGVWADNSDAGTGIPVALFATGDNVYGGAFITNGATFPALYVDNNGGTAGQFEASTGFGVSASTASGTAVHGSTSGSGNGVEGLNSTTTETEAGVLGVANTTSTTYGDYNIYAGVWGDTGTSSTSIAPAWAIGVLGTADDGHAGVFLNNSSGFSTLFVQNESTGGTGNSAGLFNTLMASSAGGTCGIGGGSMTCTGPIKSLASAGNGARTVETYGVQSPENWMEDFGTGQMEKGVAVIRIDPTFAETVSETADYHVFITPNADSKGLYVTNKTLTSFEVRESGGGTSSLSFDYRIVARRRGYEALRHLDVTDRYNAEMKAASLARGSGVVRKPAAMAKSPLQAALGSRPRPLAPALSPTPHKPMGRPANTTPHP
ncbi:MAG: hypothetical protein WCF17_08410 [Terracidiphilus sp.]